MKKLICMLMMLFMLSGCATISGFIAATENPVVKLTTQYAIIKYLQNDTTKASEAERIISELIEATEKGVLVSVADIEGMAFDMIPWEKLDNADQYALMSMLVVISDMMKDKVGEGYLEIEDNMKAVEFLTWIKQAVELAQK